MKLQLLYEMAAKKICDTCGKSMAGNHYWYKGGWKCKAANLQQAQQAAATPEEQPATQPQAQATPEPQPQPPQAQAQPAPVQQPATQQQDPEQQQGAAVQLEPLEMSLDLSDDMIPHLQKEIDKINKTAAKVGAEPVQMILGDVRFVEKRGQDPDDPDRTTSYRVRMTQITVRGTTPRLTGADGNVWNFVGVIAPSQSGRPILKLTPGAADTEGLRRLYATDPYYCDYCRKTRQRNETFIVQNGDEYRQVGRNCLKDFVGGANPQALLRFFSWFEDDEALREYLASFARSGDGGGGGRETRYYPPLDVLATTVATVQYRGGYVPAMSETRTPTGSDTRWVLYGRLDPHSTEQDRIDLRAMRAAAESESARNTAQDILNWFQGLPQETKDGNAFFRNIDTLLQDESVEARQLGYIIGLYPAYQKAQQQNSENSGVRLIKEWPEEWGDAPRPIEDRVAVVKFKKWVQGAYGPSQIINVMFEDGYGATWRYSGALEVMVGTRLRLTGTLEKETYYTPARIKFVPDRRWLRNSFKQQMDAPEADRTA